MMMRTDEAYIRSLERRIRNQRMQLRWWQNKFERGDLSPKQPSFNKSSVAKINSILKRHGPWRMTQHGNAVRRMEIRRKTDEGTKND
jgi:hypothetical protein